MIGPIFLREDLIHEFKEHITSTDYHCVIHDGIANINSTAERFELKRRNDIFNKFTHSDYPIVCKSGSKSSNPFWDYHIAVNRSKSDKDIVVNELLVREPKDCNMINAILMAFYVLINEKYKYEKLVVPMKIDKIIGYEDIEVHSKNDRTILSKVDMKD